MALYLEEKHTQPSKQQIKQNFQSSYEAKFTCLPSDYYFFDIHVCYCSMNRLSSLRYFEHCKNLRELYLRKNQIKDMKELGYLTSLENLSVLWMSGNPIAHLENYRVNVIKNIPTLKKLDNIGKKSKVYTRFFGQTLLSTFTIRFFFFIASIY